MRADVAGLPGAASTVMFWILVGALDCGVAITSQGGEMERWTMESGFESGWLQARSGPVVVLFPTCEVGAFHFHSARQRLPQLGLGVHPLL